MTVRQILDRKGRAVFTVRPDQTVLDAARLLMEHRVGSLVVCANGVTDVAGIITERDVMRIAAERPSELGTMPVHEAMTRDVWVAQEESSVEDVQRGMTFHRVRHLPVMDGRRLVGLVSIGDVLKVHVREVEGLNQDLIRYIASAYPA